MRAKTMMKIHLTPQPHQRPVENSGGFSICFNQNTFFKKDKAAVKSGDAFKSFSRIRVIAGALSALMLFQDVAWAYPENTVSASVPVPSVKGIPGSFGRVEQSFRVAGDSPTVINIRDAHRKLDSQYSISRLLAYLADEYQMDFVAMEGSSGPVHTGLLAAFPDHEARDKMADGLLRKGRLSAAEYFTITNDRSVRLYGAESPALYSKNREWFERVLALSPIATVMTRAMETRYDVEAKKILSPRALDLRAARTDFGRRKITLNLYVKRLEADSLLAGERFVHLSRYRRLLQTESRLKPERVDAERRMLIRRLRSQETALTPNLARLTADYASNKIAHAEFFRRLCALARACGVSLKEYPAARLYLRYWAEFGRLDLYGVWADIEAVERELKAMLADSPESRDFFKRDDRRILLSKLVTLGLTGEEYRRLRRDADIRRSDEVRTPDEKRLTAAALAFYAVAERRNHHLLKNTLAAMKRDGAHTAALITGGFHTEGLSDLMQQGQVSHLVIMPSFNPEGGDRPYVTVLTRRPAEWENRLSSADLFLAAPAWIGRAPINAREAEPLLAEFIAGRRAQGHPNFTAEEMRAYVSAYEALRRLYPAANPLPSKTLRELLDSIGTVRKVTPTRVDVEIGPNLWSVAVDEEGQPIASRLSSAARDIVLDFKTELISHPDKGNAGRYAVEALEPEFVTGAAAARMAEASRRQKGETHAVGNPTLPGRQRRFRSTQPPQVQELLPADTFESKAVTRQMNILRFVPEIIVAALAAVEPSLGWSWGTALVFAVRVMNAAAFLIHGTGHWINERMVRPAAERVVGIREGVSIKQIALSLLPFMPLPQTAAVPTVIATADNGNLSLKTRWIAAGGLLASGLAAWAGVYLMPGTSGSLHDAVRSAWIAVTVLTSLSRYDWLTILGLSRSIACGPLLVSRSRQLRQRTSWERLNNKYKRTDFVSAETRRRLRVQVRQAAMRGGQAVGISMLVLDRKGNPMIIYKKVVKTFARESIATVFEKTLDSLIDEARRKGYRPLPDGETVFVHLRYSTGGSTSEANTHLHHHREGRVEDVWTAVQRERDGKNEFVPVRKTVFNQIAHNGDVYRVRMRFWNHKTRNWEQRWVDYDKARVFFITAMPDSKSLANLDSKSAAEYLDFHLTAGMVGRALINAYFTVVADVPEILACYIEPFQDEPQEKYLKRLKKVIREKIREGKIPSGVSAIMLTQMPDIVEQVLRDVLAGAQGPVQNLPNEKKREIWTRLVSTVQRTFRAELGAEDMAAAFAEQFTRAFLDQGLLRVTNNMYSDLDGTFALKNITLLEPIFSLYNYQMSYVIGVDPSGQIQASSQPGAVTNALAGVEGAKILSLKDGEFAIVDWPNGHHQTTAQRLRVYRARKDAADLHVFEPIPDDELVWDDVNDNRNIVVDTPLAPDAVPLTPTEELARNLRAVPHNLDRVVRSFEPNSGKVDSNVESEDFLAAALEKAGAVYEKNNQGREPGSEPVKSAHVNWMLVGVDHNLATLSHLTEHVLGPFFPHMNCLAMDSQEAMILFREEMERIRMGLPTLYIGPDTQITFFSNSGLTLSTLMAGRSAIELKKSFGRSTWSDFGISVASQRLFNPLSQDLGQKYARTAPTLPIFFSNLSHYEPDGTIVTRTSEAATVEVTATRALFLEMIIGLAERLSKDRGTFGGPPVSRADLDMIRAFQQASYHDEAPDRVGWDIQGRQVRETDLKKPGYHNLVQEAAIRRNNVEEWPKAYLFFVAFVTAVYVGAAKWGWTPFGFIQEAHPPAWLAAAGSNIILALFFTWFTVLALRVIDGRPLFDRMLGQRHQVFVDFDSNANILFRFGNNVFGNAYSFFTPVLYPADFLKDILHKFASILHRGTLVMVRVYDDLLGNAEAEFAQAIAKIKSQIMGAAFHWGRPQIVSTVRENSAHRRKGKASSHSRQVVLSDRQARARADFKGRITPATPAVKALIARGFQDITDSLLTEMTMHYLQAVQLSRFTSRLVGPWLARRLPFFEAWQIGTSFSEPVTHSTSDGITPDGPAPDPRRMPDRVEASLKPLATVMPQRTPTPVPAPLVPPTPPEVAVPISEQTLTVTLAGEIRLSDAAGEGEPVILAATAGGFVGQSPDGGTWIAKFADADRTRFVVKKDGRAVSVKVPARAMKRLQELLPSGARMARPTEGARLAEARPMRIGVLLKNPTEQAQWLVRWADWTGRPSKASDFIFQIAVSEADRADAMAGLRSAGAWWIVDAADGTDQIPVWLKELEQVQSGQKALLQAVIAKMLSAPSAGTWAQEDWDRLLEISLVALPQAAPARLMAQNQGGQGAFEAVSATPVAVDAAELRLLLNDLDHRLADALIEPASMSDADGILSLTAEWSALVKHIAALGAGRFLSAGVLRTPFAAVDPSYHAVAVMPDRALVVTDLDVFMKDGESPYRMRIERLERLSEGKIVPALLVSDPSIQTLAQLRQKHPETAVFGEKVIFASKGEAAQRISASAADWKLSSLPTVRITAQGETDLDRSASTNLWTVSLDAEAATTIGVLETAVQLLADPTAAIPGLKKLSNHSYTYRWPKAIPTDYKRLVEALRATQVSV